jgi:hypothetical protein
MRIVSPMPLASRWPSGTTLRIVPSPSARVRDAQVQRVVEPLADRLVRVDDQQRVDRSWR